METLRLTYDQWYALPKWERERWLSREMDKEESLNALIQSVRKMDKNSAYGLNAMVLLHAMMV